MLRVGLTGGPGAGKSTVARMLAAEGFPVVDADKVAHDLYRPGSELVAELQKAFGPGVVSPDGGIERGALGRQVFGHPDRLARLGRLVHPPLLLELARRLQELEEAGERVGILEAALLLQWGPPEFIDLVIRVAASREARRARLVDGGLSPDDAERRLASVSELPEGASAVDMVVANEGSLAELERRVRELSRELRARASHSD
jgi:dephospho-CoA kinase